MWTPKINARQKQLISMYVEAHPHLGKLAAEAMTDPRAAKALGENMARLAFLPGVNGHDALLISKIGN